MGVSCGWQGSACVWEHGHGGLAAQEPGHSADSEGLDDNGAAEDDDSPGSRTAAWEQALLWAQPDSDSGFLAGDLSTFRDGTQGGAYWDAGVRETAGISGSSWPHGAGENCER